MGHVQMNQPERQEYSSSDRELSKLCTSTKEVMSMPFLQDWISIPHGRVKKKYQVSGFSVSIAPGKNSVLQPNSLFFFSFLFFFLFSAIFAEFVCFNALSCCAFIHFLFWPLARKPPLEMVTVIPLAE